jgi:hypothetical protein
MELPRQPRPAISSKQLGTIHEYRSNLALRFVKRKDLLFKDSDGVVNLDRSEGAKDHSLKALQVVARSNQSSVSSRSIQEVLCESYTRPLSPYTGCSDQFCCVKREIRGRVWPRER